MLKLDREFIAGCEALAGYPQGEDNWPLIVQVRATCELQSSGRVNECLSSEKDLDR